MKDISFDEVLDDFFKYKTSEMYTAINCRVVVVRNNGEDQRIDVQPLPNRMLQDGTERPATTILNVPVMFPASKKASLTFPIDVGDTVLCVFSQRSLDTFKAQSDNSTYSLQDRRRFSLRDAVAIPGLFPFDLAINDPKKRKWTHSTRDLVIVNNIGSAQECEIRLKENGDIQMKTDQDFYGTFNDGLIECNNLTIDCDSNLTITTGGNTAFTAGGAFNITSSTMNVAVGSLATVNVPTTNWTGNFNLTGNLGLAGSLTAAAGGGGGSTATIDIPMTINASVQINDALTATSDIVGAGISLSTHTHPGDSGGTTGTPT